MIDSPSKISGVEVPLILFLISVQDWSSGARI